MVRYSYSSSKSPSPNGSGRDDHHSDSDSESLSPSTPSRVVNKKKKRRLQHHHHTRCNKKDQVYIFQVKELVEGGSNRRSKRDSDSEHDVCVHAARWIPRAFDMHCNLDEVIKICLLVEDEASDTYDDNAEDEKTKAARRRVLQKKKSEREKFNSLLNDMQQAISRTRSDDASHLKPVIGSYAAPQPDKKRPPEQIEEGFIRGFLVERVHQVYFYIHNQVLKHIFTSPSSALCTSDGGSMRNTRASNAKIHGMAQVDAHHLAYAAMQARFSICSQDRFRELDGKFSSPEFYYRILDFILNNEDTEWIKELLSYFNRALFNDKHGLGGANARGDYDSDDDEDDLVLMKQQVAARRARLASPPDPPAQATVGSPLRHTPSSPAAPLTPLPRTIPSSPLVQPRRSPPPLSPPPRNVPKGKRKQTEDVPDHWDTGSPLSEAPNGDTENDIQHSFSRLPAFQVSAVARSNGLTLFAPSPVPAHHSLVDPKLYYLLARRMYLDRLQYRAIYCNTCNIVAYLKN
ncbi:hypothetical protein BU15DRAFT_61267 [Melanogaster broomeanus]|nr:hypothetical protein BU15DRAFT_61267 [Melanogaster broomeanus]